MPSLQTERPWLNQFTTHTAWASVSSQQQQDCHLRCNPPTANAAPCVVLQKNGVATSNEPPVVGFCFSFAVEQQALDSGKLMGWTKGFDVDGVVGKDVVQLLSGQ